MKDHGGPISDGLANSVVGQVAAEALSVRIPALPPFLGAVFPLADTRADGLSQDRDRPACAEQIQMKALGFGQLARLVRSDHAENFVHSGLGFGPSGDRRFARNRRPPPAPPKGEKEKEPYK